MKPLIIEYATEREDTKHQFDFEYDHNESLNVVYIQNEKKAIIDTNNHDLSMLTKTKVYQESDDFNINMLEMKTKTRVHQESDDAYNQIVGLDITTYVKQERDD